LGTRVRQNVEIIAHTDEEDAEHQTRHRELEKWRDTAVLVVTPMAASAMRKPSTNGATSVINHFVEIADGSAWQR
jgi:hypothetical protein